MATSVWLVLIAQPLWAQTDGAALMRAGNAAFREGDYAAAIAAYRDALEAGFETPLVRYNLGLAHYRLGEYAEAEIALERASADPNLEALATYNLGLTSLAAGWLDAARVRFEQVGAIARDPALIGLAERGLNRVDAREAAAGSSAASPRRPYREPAPPVGDLYFAIAARYGTDDNVYRSPGAPYVDPTLPGQPTVAPVSASAAFMPVDLVVDYVIDAPEQRTTFNFGYRLNGDFYDSAYSNANRLDQRFDLGAEVALEGRHARSLRATFFAVAHDETNFDPDTGLDRDYAGRDIADRFTYRGAGIEARYTQALIRWAFGFDSRFERRSFASVPLVAGYDNEFYHVNLWGERSLGTSTDLQFSVQGYRREYDARRARDLTGRMLRINPTLAYAYESAEIGAVRRFGPDFSVRAWLNRIERADNFEGYADYSQQSAGLELVYRPNRRTRLGVAAWARSYDYPNAFAFNDPIAGQLDIDSADAVLDFEYRFNGGLSLWTEFLHRDESSTDPRLSYVRNRLVAGLKWRL